MCARTTASTTYRPCLACHEGFCITVVPRDRNISNAQESGLDPAWFANELRQQTSTSPRPHETRLVTTWSDGENGGWFRQMHEDSGFFGRFFAPYMEHVRSGDFPATPVSLSRHLSQQDITARAWVQTGAWNVGSSSGYDLSQWAGSEPQQLAVSTLQRISARYHRLASQVGRGQEDLRKLLDEARRWILEAQTSCFLFWGDDWIPQLYERSDPAERLLEKVEGALQAGGGGSTKGS